MLVRAAKLVFLHPSKTGGTAIENVLFRKYSGLELNGKISEEEQREYWWGRNSWQHWSYQEMLETFPFTKDWFWFVTVRHPFERMVSEFRYQIDCDCNASHLSAAHRKFDINKALEDRSFWKHCSAHHHRKQTAYLGPNVHILRQETLADDWQRLTDQLGIDFPPLRPLGVSCCPKPVLNEKSKKQLFSIYSPDFAALGYTP